MEEVEAESKPGLNLLTRVAVPMTLSSGDFELFSHIVDKRLKFHQREIKS